MRSDAGVWKSIGDRRGRKHRFRERGPDRNGSRHCGGLRVEQPLPLSDLPGLIGSVHAALVGLGKPAEPAAEQVEKPTPAQIRKSITPDALISFIDGKPYKTLKRHLSAKGFDPNSYRQHYGLPSDYPMVSPNYAAQRSELARAIGLGRPGAQAAQSAVHRLAAAARPPDRTLARLAIRAGRLSDG